MNFPVVIICRVKIAYAKDIIDDVIVVVMAKIKLLLQVQKCLFKTEKYGNR